VSTAGLRQWPTVALYRRANPSTKLVARRNRAWAMIRGAPKVCSPLRLAQGEIPL
jgi:hypothetical protein